MSFGFTVRPGTKTIVCIKIFRTIFVICNNTNIVNGGSKRIIAVLLMATIENKTLRICLKEKLLYSLKTQHSKIWMFETLQLPEWLWWFSLCLCAACDSAAESSKAAGGGFGVTSAAPADQHADRRPALRAGSGPGFLGHGPFYWHKPFRW